MNGAERPRPHAGSTCDGRVVPVYAVTGGRTRSTERDLPIESIVTATCRGSHDLEPEYRTIVTMAARPVTLVEIGVVLGVPVGVARVLVGDLAASGHLDVHGPPSTSDGNPHPAILARLLEGLRAR